MDRGAHRTVSDASEALALTGITHRFGAVTAIDDVSMTLRAGTVHALLGENGAGKSTLMRIAHGMIRPDAGQVAVNGTVRALASQGDAIAAGLGMVHQHFTLVPAMTVAENIALGGRGPWSQRAAERVVEELSARTGFALDPRAVVGSLPVGAQQRVEIAKALARRARVLVLDEPTGVLAPGEVQGLLRWLRAFVAQGNAAVLITHKLREALDVADDVTVLRRGARMMSGPAREASEQSLTAAMIGGAVERAPRSPRVPRHDAPVVFRADDLVVRDAGDVVRVRSASFRIAAGEIVGIAAVEGSGQRELLRALAGRLPVSSGTLVRPPAVGFVPEDRHGDAVLLERSLAENVALRGLGGARGVMHWDAVRARTRTLMADFDVRADGPDVRMRALSGGNQQKLVLARELEDGPGLARGAPPERQGAEDRTADHHRFVAPSVDSPPPTASALVVENPTRGLDVRATAAVHDRLREAADRGAAVVFHASDLDEVLLLASRVLVIFGGTVRETPLQRDAIGRAMVGFHS